MAQLHDVCVSVTGTTIGGSPPGQVRTDAALDGAMSDAGRRLLLSGRRADTTPTQIQEAAE